MKYETKIAITKTVFALVRELAEDDKEAFMAIMDKKPYERRTIAIVEDHLNMILALADGVEEPKKDAALLAAIDGAGAEIEGGN